MSGEWILEVVPRSNTRESIQQFIRIFGILELAFATHLQLLSKSILSHLNTCVYVYVDVYINYLDNTEHPLIPVLSASGTLSAHKREATSPMA